MLQMIRLGEQYINLEHVLGIRFDVQRWTDDAGRHEVPCALVEMTATMGGDEDGLHQPVTYRFYGTTVATLRAWLDERTTVIACGAGGTAGVIAGMADRGEMMRTMEHFSDEQHVVTLYEDGAGHLFLVIDETDAAWDVTQVQGANDFRVDAAAALCGETEDWTVPQVRAGDVIGQSAMVAEYDVVGDEVRLLWDLVGGAMPGRAATRYLGPDAPEEEG